MKAQVWDPSVPWLPDSPWDPPSARAPQSYIPPSSAASQGGDQKLAALSISL